MMQANTTTAYRRGGNGALALGERLGESGQTPSTRQLRELLLVGVTAGCPWWARYAELTVLEGRTAPDLIGVMCCCWPPSQLAVAIISLHLREAVRHHSAQHATDRLCCY